jgi:hypothetical protein
MLLTADWKPVIPIPLFLTDRQAVPNCVPLFTKSCLYPFSCFFGGKIGRKIHNQKVRYTNRDILNFLRMLLG